MSGRLCATRARRCLESRQEQLRGALPAPAPRKAAPGAACCLKRNSIRHNLSLHTRFIRVQNEGTGKSSWWMLNPEGGKMGKTPRRRAVSMDNSTKYLKSKGRARGKRVGRPGIVAGSAVVLVGLQGSPDRGSPPRPKVLSGTTATAGVEGGEFDAWTDLHSRASSSTSTLSGRLSPILAEAELEEPEEGRMSCSTSPHLYPSPSSARSPAVGTGSHCPPPPPPPLEQLPQLASLTAAIGMEDRLLEDGYLLHHHQHQQPPQQQQQQHPTAGRSKHQAPVYHYSPGGKAQSSYGSSVYGASALGLLRHHSPMQTIQENKPASFSGTMRAYSSTNALQSLLTGTGAGPQQYCSKDVAAGHESDPGHPMMSTGSNGAVGSSHRGCHPGHLNGHGHAAVHSHDGSHSHSSGLNHSSVSNHGLALNGHGLAQSHGQTHAVPRGVTGAANGRPQPYSHKAPYLYSPPSHAHLPASTTLPPNPAGMLGIPQDSCHVAAAPHPRHNHYPGHQGMADRPYHHHHHLHNQGMVGGGGSSGGGSYHGYHQPYPHERLPADLDIDMFHGSLECDVDSILLHDIMDSGEEMDFNFDCSLAQGMGMGMGMGMGGLAGAQQNHNNQSWVPG
ncbi:hypothetical protein CRUP_028505 [Coryphaenoides rupestris]|nr:hypothetical protein CRUP_028505 [Coryphaenoides rupestris]